MGVIRTDQRTLAQQLFGGKQILVARPPEMAYDEYRALLYLQNKTLRKLFTHQPSRNIARLMSIRPFYNSHPR